jgi:hypothetical protein
MSSGAERVADCKGDARRDILLQDLIIARCKDQWRALVSTVMNLRMHAPQDISRPSGLEPGVGEPPRVCKDMLGGM